MQEGVGGTRHTQKKKKRERERAGAIQQLQQDNGKIPPKFSEGKGKGFPTSNPTQLNYQLGMKTDQRYVQKFKESKTLSLPTFSGRH